MKKFDLINNQIFLRKKTFVSNFFKIIFSFGELHFLRFIEIFFMIRIYFFSEKNSVQNNSTRINIKAHICIIIIRVGRQLKYMVANFY